MNSEDKIDEVSADGVHNREVYRVAAKQGCRSDGDNGVDCLRCLD